MRRPQEVSHRHELRCTHRLDEGMQLGADGLWGLGLGWAGRRRVVQVAHPKMFHMCWALSDGSSKLIPIDEQPNHQIVHLVRLGKTDRAAHEPFNPGPEIDVFALNFLGVLLVVHSM